MIATAPGIDPPTVEGTVQRRGPAPLRVVTELVGAVGRMVGWWIGIAAVLMACGGGMLLLGRTGPQPLVLALLGLSAACLGLAGWLAPSSATARAGARSRRVDARTSPTDGEPSSPGDVSGEMAILDATAALGQAVALLAIRVGSASGEPPRAQLERVRSIVGVWVPAAPQHPVRDDTLAVLVPSAQVGLVAPLVLHRAQKALGSRHEVRVGVAFYPDDGRGLGELSRAALSAVQRSAGPLALVSHESAERARLRDRLASELRAAIRDQEIVAHFQPVADARSLRVVGAEALARWLRADGDIIEASEFVAATEGSGAALDLGARMVRHACRLGVAWRERADRGAFVAVNLSDTELRDGRTVELVREELAACALRPTALRVEVPYATARRGQGPSTDAVAELVALGVPVWIESFDGSLPEADLCARLGAQGIKLPVTALLGETDLPDDAACRWLDTVRACGLQVHVARVESASQLRRLTTMSAIDFVQGYAVAATVTQGEVPDLLGRPAAASGVLAAV